MNKILLAAFFVLMTWGSFAQVHYKVYDTRTKSVSSLEAVVSSLENANVMFFGEEHNDSIGHCLQDTLYRMLLDRYKHVTLSMEMFERDNQVVLDEYLAGLITEAQLVKEGRAWKNYKDYRKPVNQAKERKQKVIAANAPRRYVSSVSREGLASLHKFPEQSRDYFAPLPIDTTNEAYALKFRKAMGGHGSSNIYYAQALWDATMSHSIYKAWKKEKETRILHLNGRFHSDERLGTVTQLQRKIKKLQIITISCFPSDDFQNPQWNDHVKLADFIILTDPAVPRTF